MSNLEKWIRAILNEDADKLSIGSVRTLQIIKQEIKSMQERNMEDKRRINVLRTALYTIFFEAKEPIIKVYAQSALDETKYDTMPQPVSDSYCKIHGWFGTVHEKCPECTGQLNT